MTNASHQEFYDTLLKKASKAYEDSPASKFKKQLHYSVAATPIRPYKGLVIGINWGGSEANQKAQETMPGEDELTEEIIKKDYKFLQRSVENLEKYFKLQFNKVDFNYSNICFFRTHREKDLTFQDYKNSFPLFRDYVEYLNPSWILIFGVTVVNRIVQIDSEAITEKKAIYDDEQKFYGYKGLLIGIPFYCVPHPNARLKNNSRNKIWEKMEIKLPDTK